MPERISAPPPRLIRIHLAVLLLLAAAGFAVFRPVLNAEFLNYDDPIFIADNPRLINGLTWDSLRWALTANLFHYTPTSEYWSPITLLTRLFDVTFFGLDPHAHHAVSLALHIITAFLLYLALCVMTGRLGRAALVALLFAVHPANVECLGWLSARKDIVCGAFWMVILLAFARHARRQTAGSYAVFLFACVLGAMTKPMIMTLPFLLLLLDYWPLNRLQPDAGTPAIRRRAARLLLEQVPVVILSVLAAILAINSQRNWKALQPLGVVSLNERLSDGLQMYFSYLRRFFVPMDLNMIYRYPADLTLGAAAVAGAGLLAITAICFLLRRRAPYLIVGWLWFAGALLPVIGFIPIGASHGADRYLYLPMVGLCVAFVWGSADLLNAALAFLRGKFALLATAARGAAGCAFLAWGVWLAIVAHRQSAVWHDSLSLFGRAERLAPGIYLVDLNLAGAEKDGGDLSDALVHYRQAAMSQPSNPQPYYGMGDVLQQMGRNQEAARILQHCIDLDPRFTLAYVRLGVAMAEMGDTGAALRLLDKAREIFPLLPEIYYREAIIKANLGQWPEAIKEGTRLVEMKPANADNWLLLARLYKNSGDRAGALNALARAPASAAKDPRIITEVRNLQAAN